MDPEDIHQCKGASRPGGTEEGARGGSWMEQETFEVEKLDWNKQFLAV